MTEMWGEIQGKFDLIRVSEEFELSRGSTVFLTCTTVTHQNEKKAVKYLYNILFLLSPAMHCHHYS